MSGLFGSPDVPPAPTPAAPAIAPTIDDARQKRIQQDGVLQRQGRAADILTSSQGDLSAPTTSAKSLLGG